MRNYLKVLRRHAEQVESSSEGLALAQQFKLLLRGQLWQACHQLHQLHSLPHIVQALPACETSIFNR